MKGNKSGRILYIALIIISAILLAVFGTCVFLAIKNENFGIVNYISVTSSFSVALLTVIYVYASTKQMHVMKLQLDEMKREHMLNTQPILILDEPEFIIEFPKFFYTPPGNEFSFQSRYFLKAKLVNASDDPGIIICIVVSIVIPGKEKQIVLKTINERLSISSSNDSPKQIEFMFVDDKNCALIDAIRDHKWIKINTAIYYKNTSGACFSTINAYSLKDANWGRWIIDDDGKIEDADIQAVFREWHTAIVQAPTKYKERLQELKRIVRDEDQEEKYRRLFDQIEADFYSMYATNSNLICALYEDNNAFELKTISEEEFENATDDSDYLKSLIKDDT